MSAQPFSPGRSRDGHGSGPELRPEDVPALIELTHKVEGALELPDAWEAGIIKTRLLDPKWPKGQAYSAVVDSDGHRAFRVMVPEYYPASCLTCHGSPKGEMDITGYPKEGGKVGDLGAEPAPLWSAAQPLWTAAQPPWTAAARRRF